jgi:hypothetical protein
MSVYPLQELKNKITDRILDNHERAITGDELQEVLLDVLDSLETYTDEAVVEPAVNYYVDEVAFDIATGALTLTRAGGITPENISCDLDGRYKQIGESDTRADNVSVNAGVQSILFGDPYPEGTVADDIVIPVIWALTNEDDTVPLHPYDKTRFGFKVKSPAPANFSYTATLK